MTVTLDKSTLENLRKIIAAQPHSAHAKDGKAMLAKWAVEKGLTMDSETRSFLEELVTEYPTV